MSRLIETLKIENGIIHNVRYHNERINSTRLKLFNCQNEIKLENYIKLSDKYSRGVFKCRVIYSFEIESIEILEYTKREIKTLKIVYSDIDYRYKFENRTGLNKLLDMRGNYDEIMIVKNHLITDTSFTNLAFFDGNNWYTPLRPLLKGTKRQKLIDERLLSERNISVADLNLYEKVSLINSMLELGEIEIKVCNINIFELYR